VPVLVRLAGGPAVFLEEAPIAAGVSHSASGGRLGHQSHQVAITESDEFLVGRCGRNLERPTISRVRSVGRCKIFRIRSVQRRIYDRVIFFYADRPISDLGIGTGIWDWVRGRANFAPRSLEHLTNSSLRSTEQVQAGR